MIPFPEWNPAQSLKILVSFNFVDLKFTHHNNAKVSTATFVVFMYCKWTLNLMWACANQFLFWSKVKTDKYLRSHGTFKFPSVWKKKHPHAAIVFFPIPHRWRGEPVKDSSVTGFHRWRGDSLLKIQGLSYGSNFRRCVSAQIPWSPVKIIVQGYYLLLNYNFWVVNLSTFMGRLWKVISQN